MTIFDNLWNNWPTEARDVLFNSLGGNWPSLYPNDNYKNTCTIRFSVALNRSGYKVPASLSDGGHKDQEGNSIAVRVPTGESLARNFFGEPYWGMNRNPGSPIDLTNVPRENGLLIYKVRVGDANGHVDLWKKNDCLIDCHASFAAASYELAFWKLA
ncbi:T6SS effector amidase Tae4 family protein [Bradyrhizobium paxllaeri]|uniref:T6SS effector amidase Tae4 family protein n=1 Tax=Bradyrhizobium paxllaeri TaxID=190148 RepID=UPI00114709C8|nr:T6SS effector amidase Tae4 family protein [Bradyrhizobium paxllaeri]